MSCDRRIVITGCRQRGGEEDSPSHEASYTRERAGAMLVAAIVGELSRLEKLPPNAVVERMVGSS